MPEIDVYGLDLHETRYLGPADVMRVPGGWIYSNTIGGMVFVPWAKTSKAYEMAGLKRIFITSGANKVPFDASGSFKKEFLDELQEDVNNINETFAQHVSAHTGLDVDTIKGFQAGVFSGSVAVEKGLANKTMTTREFASYVAAIHKGTIQ